ncbi:hypothetical protein [Arthrobacter sp. JCM 19049]|uniref:hypothetical protein n=1 Tax=Arthrobacter sp. JCM 19049 TaxID=1460643 RepID=UPI0024370EA5|nr:hypothetical protein [Arthrobacter sp. JCM 19049]
MLAVAGTSGIFIYGASLLNTGRETITKVFDEARPSTRSTGATTSPSSARTPAITVTGCAPTRWRCSRWTPRPASR